MTKVLQRKPKQKQEEIEDEEILQALTKEVQQQRSKSQKYQPKSKSELIEDQLKRMPAFNNEITKPRPQAVSRTGLKPRILGGQHMANYYKNDRSNSSFENLKQFRDNVRAKIFAQNRQPKVKVSTQQDIDDEVSKQLSDASFSNQLSPGGKYQYYDHKIEITPRTDSRRSSVTTPVDETNRQARELTPQENKNKATNLKQQQSKDISKAQKKHPSQIPPAPSRAISTRLESKISAGALKNNSFEQQVQEKQTYKCKLCGTPLLNLMFLKGEVLTDDQMLCQLCIEKKYKEMQLLQLQLLNKKSQQRQQQLQQIQQQVEERDIKEAQNNKQEENSQNQMEKQEEQQNIQLEQINKNIEELKTALEAKNNQIQDLQAQLLKKNTEIIQNTPPDQQKTNILNEQRAKSYSLHSSQESNTNSKIQNDKENQKQHETKQEMPDNINSVRRLQNLAEDDLSLSKTNKINSPNKNLSALQQQMQEMQKQLQLLTAQKAQTQEIINNGHNQHATIQGQPVTVLQINPPATNAQDHQHHPKGSRTLDLLGQLNDELLQNFPFVIQKRVCSVCGQVLGVTIVDPRNKNQRVSHSELRETLRVATITESKSTQNEDKQPKSDLQYYKKPKKSPQNDVNETLDDTSSLMQSDEAQRYSRRKKKKIEKLLQLEDRLAQLQLHDTAIVNSPQRVWVERSKVNNIDQKQDPIEAAKALREEEIIYVINEAPPDQYVSGTGDLGFRVRKGQ